MLEVRGLPLARLVDALMELRPTGGASSGAASSSGSGAGGAAASGAGDEGYLYLDPKLPAGSVPGTGRRTMPFRQAVVFVVGGGTYTEYHALQELARVCRGDINNNVDIFLLPHFLPNCA